MNASRKEIISAMEQFYVGMLSVCDKMMLAKP